MPKRFKLKHSIAENVTARPQDILAAKRFLYRMGFYKAPDWGITDIPDRALFTGIRDYQRANGLREDGIIKPGGETEARMSNANAGTDNSHGSYIWRTVGDGKVRSSHADRDGKTFSWDNPPDGGHPGEAYNCRCRAEDVEEEDKCKELQDLMEKAWHAHDKLHDQYLDLDATKGRLQAELGRVRSMDPREFISDEEYENTESEYLIGRLGKEKLKEKVPLYDYHQIRTIGEVIKRDVIKELTEHLNKTIAKIAALKEEIKKRYDIAGEYSRRHRKCIGNNK